MLARSLTRPTVTRKLFRGSEGWFEGGGKKKGVLRSIMIKKKKNNNNRKDTHREKEILCYTRIRRMEEKEREKKANQNG